MDAPLDTAPAARRRQVEILRSMTPGERLARGLELMEDIRGLALAGVRARHPGLPEAEVFRLFLRLHLPASTADRVAAMRAARRSGPG